MKEAAQHAPAPSIDLRHLTSPSAPHADTRCTQPHAIVWLWARCTSTTWAPRSWVRLTQSVVGINTTSGGRGTCRRSWERLVACAYSVRGRAEVAHKREVGRSISCGGVVARATRCRRAVSMVSERSAGSMVIVRAALRSRSARVQPWSSRSRRLQKEPTKSESKQPHSAGWSTKATSGANSSCTRSQQHADTRRERRVHTHSRHEPSSAWMSVDGACVWA
jgi:hypothetical protein